MGYRTLYVYPYQTKLPYIHNTNIEWHNMISTYNNYNPLLRKKPEHMHKEFGNITNVLETEPHNDFPALNPYMMKTLTMKNP